MFRELGLLVMAVFAVMILAACSPMRDETKEPDERLKIVQLKRRESKSRTSICTYCHDSQKHAELASKRMSH